MSMTEDGAAIARCQQGDIAGLEPLMQRHQVAALRLAYLLTGDRALAEDIVQESFLLALRGIERFHVDQPFAPWLYRIVTNLAKQHKRSATQRHEVSVATFDDEDLAFHQGKNAASSSNQHDPATQVERGEERAALHEALASLTMKQREAVVLRYYLGCDDQTMATILGCRPGTARQRLHEGLRALQTIIRQRYAWLLDEQSPSLHALLPEELRHGAE